MAPAVFVFVFIYLVSFMLVMGFEEWFMVWIGLEVNMMSFISVSYDKNSWKGSEGLYSYFFIQSLSSGVFLVLVYMGYSLVIPLMMSIAAGPFYFWFPSVAMGVGWGSCLLLMTFQSFLPLVILSGNSNQMVYIFGMISMVVGMMGSFSQTLLSLLLSYSSISHLGWMLVGQSFKGMLWFYYFVVYSMLVGLVVVMIMGLEVNSVEDIGIGNLMLMLVMVMSMGGLPPFIGFMMKWMVLELVMEVSMILSMLMVFTSLIMIYIYCRLIYESMLGGVGLSGWLMFDYSFISYFLIFSMVGLLVLPVFLWMFMLM